MQQFYAVTAEISQILRYLQDISKKTTIYYRFSILAKQITGYI